MSPAEKQAAEIFDEAMKASGLSNKEAARICGVSQSLVEKWRSRKLRGTPSLVQILELGPTVQLEMFRAVNRRTGYGRQLLGRAMDDIAGVFTLTSESR